MRRVYIAGKLNAMAVDYIRHCHEMMQWAETVRKLGYSVYVPCVDFLMGVQFGYYTYDDYFNNSQPWLDVSDAVFVCPGWESSSGTKREIARAQKKNIPVVYSIGALIKEIGNEQV
jgi:hypothetical protein